MNKTEDLCIRCKTVELDHFQCERDGLEWTVFCRTCREAIKEESLEIARKTAKTEREARQDIIACLYADAKQVYVIEEGWQVLIAFGPCIECGIPAVLFDGLCLADTHEEVTEHIRLRTDAAVAAHRRARHRQRETEELERRQRRLREVCAALISRIEEIDVVLAERRN